MRLRTKILISHAVMAVSVTLITVVIIAALRLADRNQQHLHSSYEQIRRINLVAALANDFAEQIAEMFIMDVGVDRAIAEARSGLHRQLDKIQPLIEEQLALAETPEHREQEQQELVHLEAMRAVVRDLDAAQADMYEHLAAGRRAAAEELYRARVEHRLDTELDAMIQTSMRVERAEVEEAIAFSTQLSRRLTKLAIGAAGVVVLISLGNAAVLNRTISRPIAALAAGADAVGRGELTHVVGHASRDEFGNLAARFDEMTRQIREQRDGLMQAQATLTEQVAERTAELTQRTEELEHANARLREIDTSRAQFLADISHELRTPLTVLRGQTEVACATRIRRSRTCGRRSSSWCARPARSAGWSTTCSFSPGPMPARSTCSSTTWCCRT
jgi:nitrogen fixation/metabolism regulation signal transduction histidine kinase